ncbi:MAG: MATE family efflux transporter [Elusimicrobia bacterium]|nr:MATE family efflux transporter [Elusimicrobiota bacterium]
MNKPAPGSPRELLNLAYPLILSTASATIMQFVNRVFLSRYSSDALAACVPAGILAFSFGCFFMGTASYTNAFVAQYHGRKLPSKVTLSLWQGVWLSLLAWILLLFLTPAGLWIINASGHAPSVKILEERYFLILNCGGGLSILNAALAAFFVGRSKTKVTMLVNIASNLLNVLLTWLLVFGVGPLPELGIEGAAYSFLAGQTAMALAYITLILTPKNRKKYRTLQLARLDRPLFLRLLKYGMPNGIGFMLDVASFTVFIFLVGNMDKISLAANNVIASINSLAFMPVIGLGMATLTLTGQYIGARKREVAETVAYTGMKIAVSYALTLSLIFVLFPHALVDMFGQPNSPDYAAILEASRSLMKMLAVFILFDAVGIIFGDALRGAGDTRFQMTVALVCAWLIFVPGIYYLTHAGHASLQVIWWWAAFYVSALAAVLWMRIRSGKWLETDILKR